ncbi:DUF6678 family protein [Brevundimonas sp. FT23042]|uniref:DUF6678 family protein n=1 Tax=Brevundimonas sp. FT23042 TaxID=3393749 RepID=UPI003B586D5F
MSVHDRKELERESRIVRRETRASLMSDTKWRKLLLALDENGLSDLWYVFRFVDDPTEHVRTLRNALWPPRPWIDGFEWGPSPLRSIEWMLLPSVLEYPPAGRASWAKSASQDIDEAAKIIASLGQYPVERTDRGLLIRGYLPAVAAG